MEWETEVIETKRTKLRWEKDGIVAEIEDGYTDILGNEAVNLNITKEHRFTYGKGTAVSTLVSLSGNGVERSVTAYKTAVLTTWYNGTCKSIEDAKALAEEIIPLFKSVGAD